MRKLLFLMLLMPYLSLGQSTGIVSTIAGTGSAGYSGDGGSALLAKFNNLGGMCTDRKGNIIVADFNNHRIRKIGVDGIVNTIAGTGIPGYSGDGGAATSAQLYYPNSVAIDSFQNIYITDEYNSRIRKIDSNGIISTFAGNGSSLGAIGDGGPATAAFVHDPMGICRDSHGNTYITQMAGRIRKIDVYGIITTIAGCDTYGYSGDGGPATNATFNIAIGIAVDSRSNIYIVDNGNGVIRKINPAGIISTFVGGGSAMVPMPCAATATSFYHPTSICFDSADNLYMRNSFMVSKIDTFGYATLLSNTGVMPTYANGLPLACLAEQSSVGFCMTKSGDLLMGQTESFTFIRKVQYTPDAVSSNLRVYFYSECGSLGFTLTTGLSTSGLHIRTNFGDGSTSTTNFGTGCTASVINVSHNYFASGLYHIKHILYSGITPIDSVCYDRQFSLCNVLHGSVYLASSSSCTFDPATSLPLYQPVKIEIDSNGTPVDTISTTSGIFYHPLIDSGAVYSLRVVALPSGLSVMCPSSGVLFDSLGNNLPVRFALTCGSATGEDLSVRSTSTCGRHMSIGQISVNNSFCTPANGTVTLRFSPQYVFDHATPAPSSVVGNVATWNVSGMSATSAVTQINYSLTVAGAWLPPGDTINTDVTITSWGTDDDSTNNHCHHIDTVKSSFDPNMITVSPSGYILPKQKLEYAITFENTGNDTAHNIYVMDTLPSGVNPHSLTILSASAALNTTMLNDGTHNIVKFEFPNINLLDSSHHGHCTGTVYFSINTYPWLTDGTSIINHAGIFFDDNPVVLTDTAINVINMIHGSSTSCIGLTDTLIERAPGGQWSGSNSHASVSSTGVVTGISSGSVVATYTIIDHTDTMVTTKSVSIIPAVSVPAITGSASVCVGASTMMNDSLSGGIWSMAGGHASISSGLVTGLSEGADTVRYTVNTACGVLVATHPVSLLPLPDAGTITGSSSICVGVTATLTPSLPSGTWSVTGGAASVAAGVVSAAVPGTDTVHYMVTNTCGSAIATHIVTVLPLPATSTLSGLPTVCQGASISVNASVAGGTWSLSSPSASVAAGAVTGISAGIDTVLYSISNSCGISTATYPITILPLPDAGVISGATSVCIGAALVLSETASGGAWTVTNGLGTVAAGTVTGVGVGVDTVIYSVFNSCGVANTSYIINIVDLPIAGSITGPSSVCMGETIALTATAIGGAWMATNSNATVTAGSIIGLVPGVDTIIYTVSNTCGAASAMQLVTVDPCGLMVNQTNPIASAVMVFPNPANDVLHVAGDQAIYHSYELSNTLGSKVMQGTFDGNNIDIKALPTGVYYLKVIGDAGFVVRKVVKE